MTEPFNLDAISAEATGEPFRFVFGGHTYEMPAGLDFIQIRLLQTGDIGSALQRLLGSDQWDRLVASDDVLNLERLEALMNAYARHLGITVGESSASSSSSSSTARPSKRTSRATTKSR